MQFSSLYNHQQVWKIDSDIDFESDVDKVDIYYAINLQNNHKDSSPTQINEWLLAAGC